MNKWFLLITSLATGNATARMRIWRSLKSSGAAVLRDGVYLMPDHPDCLRRLENFAAEIRGLGGVAFVLQTDEPAGVNFPGFFDRREAYSALHADIIKLQTELASGRAQDTRKQLRKLRKAFSNLSAIDFFPGETQRQIEAALSELELSVARVLSPDEPHSVSGAISSLSIADFHGKTWATRQRPWADRLACAWLIRRFIDTQSRLLWLASPSECPADAIGFDFDGARFSHIDGRVTFEVLLVSFALETPSLRRLAELIHFMDVGGVQPPEAVGIETLLTGMRDAIDDDNQLLVATSVVFDSLLVAFEKGDIIP
ncbi:MAG: chromate resistance protein ChrB domain-containing protein [Gammaproteobacteria bacterium]